MGTQSEAVTKPRQALTGSAGRLRSWSVDTKTTTPGRGWVHLQKSGQQLGVVSTQSSPIRNQPDEAVWFGDCYFDVVIAQS